MKVEYIKLQGYNLLDIIECSIHQEINEHSVACIRGHISDKDEDTYIRKGLVEEYATIIAVDEKGNEFKIFNGLIYNFSIDNLKGSKLLTLELRSSSYAMDLTEKIRSFQNVTVTYDSVISTIMTAYNLGSGEVTQNALMPINKYLVQYNETDWAFVKRIASLLNTYVFVDAISDGTHISIGIPLSYSEQKISHLEYKINIEKENCYYTIKSRDFVNLGDKVYFSGSSFVVTKIDSNMEGAELYYTYELKPSLALRKEKYENEKIVGVSLEAIVSNVEEDKVQVEIAQDTLIGQQIWFPYATIYSSPDGTGWYCMPENEDRVRVYFPNSNEAEAYVMSSVHIGDAQSTGARSNPNEKSIKSKHGKEILFKENELLITNGSKEQEMSIRIVDEEGIYITSAHKIEFKAEEGVQIVSTNANIQLIAKEQIMLKQNESYINIQDDITIDGGRVKTV